MCSPSPPCEVRSPAWDAEDRAVMSMSFSPDGSVLATAGSEGTATLWESAPESESARRCPAPQARG